MITRHRILHVIDHLGPGGGQETLLNLATYANRRRFRLEVATLHGFGVYGQTLRQQQIPVHVLSFQKYLPLYLPNLMRLLRRRSFDLVHCHLMAANLLAKPLAALCRVPVIFSHDQCNDALRRRQPGLLLLDRLANRWSDRIIAVSASTRDFLIEHEKIAAEKIVVIYNPVDPARFYPGGAADRQSGRRRLGLAQKVPVVLGVGRLHQQKNFPGFLRVAAQLAQHLPQVQFLIAGDGPQRQRLEILAQQLGLGGRVHFLGYVKHMRELYLASDVLFLPSWYEGTPLVVLEAMACGLPVVASQVDGAAEILRNGVNGFLAPPEEQEVFCRRLSAVLQDHSLAQTLATQALATVRQHFTAPVITAQVESLYTDCLGSP